MHQCCKPAAAGGGDVRLSMSMLQVTGFLREPAGKKAATSTAGDGEAASDAAIGEFFFFFFFAGTGRQKKLHPHDHC